MKNKTLLVIAGPTASGKTAVAIELALRFNTVIISADSRQCYRGMAIGTAQPTQEELATVKHHFIDQYSVTDAKNAGDFEALAVGWLEELFQHHDVVILCGGTGLYIKAVCEGLDPMPEVDPKIVAKVESDYARLGLSWLQETLIAEDPSFTNNGELANPARLLRALSFVRSTGTSISAYRTGTKKERPFKVVKYALEVPRPKLYMRINVRTEQMMKAGLLEEVKNMLPYRHLPPLQTVGYSELFEYLDGSVSLEYAVEKIAQHTRNYAKRQVTWFKKDPQFNWIAPDQLLSLADITRTGQEP